MECKSQPIYTHNTGPYSWGIARYIADKFEKQGTTLLGI
jgi:hypothetical protein